MRKVISLFLSTCIMFSLVLSVHIPIQPVYATQTKTANFSKAYTLTGNNADDIVAVAKAQLNKTGSDLGYSEQWCADFTNDCAKLANIPSNVIPHEYASRGSCIYMYNYMINNCNAKVVSTPQKGDIVFFDWAGNKSVSNLHHVAIVTGYSNNTISIIGGNQGSSSSLYSRSVSTTSYSINNANVAKIVRPNYNNAPIEPIVVSEKYYPKCSNSYTSIVDALKSIGEESSYSYRSTIAQVNGISNYSGTAAQNTQMLNLLKNGTLINPYYVEDTPYEDTPAPTVESNTYFPACGAGYTSIVEALKSIGVDSSYSYRARIAETNGITGYSGTAEQNIEMLNKLKNGVLCNPDSPRSWYSDLTPVNLGDSFNALILCKEPWITLRAGSDDNLVLYKEEGISSEMWRFYRQNDGSYVIKNFMNGKVIDVYGLGTDNGTNVFTCDENGGENQKWFIYEMNGGYVFRPSYTDKVLDVTGAAFSSGTNIEIYQKNDSSAQIFSIYKEGTDYGKPMIPEISAAANGLSVKVSIGKSAYCDYYKLYRSTDNKNFTLITETKEQSYTDNNLKYSTKYYYKVEFVNRYYTESKTVSATTQNQPTTTSTTTTSKTTTTTTIISTTTTKAVEPLKIEQTEITLENGDQFSIIANHNNLTYKSNNPDIAVVSKNGVVTAVGEGSAIISVINEKFDVVQLRVSVVQAKVIGDCNDDGALSIADAVMLQSWLLGRTRTLPNWKAADLCEDNRLDVFDMVRMRQLLIENIYQSN